MRPTVLTVLAFIAVSGAAQADAFEPLGAAPVELGGFHGVAYYTQEPGGLRVVATLAEGEGGQPLRFVATLADRQSITISVPGAAGAPAETLELMRTGDRVVLSAPAGDLSN